MNQNLYDHILIRYGELSLKKSNRKQFTQKVNDHIKGSLRKFPELKFENRGMRYYIHLNGVDPNLVIPYLEKISGIFSFSVINLNFLKRVNQELQKRLPQSKSLQLQIMVILVYEILKKTDVIRNNCHTYPIHYEARIIVFLLLILFPFHD